MPTFETEMRRAQVMQKREPELQEFWIGYQRGLRRAHHGESFGTAEEHHLWLSLINSEDSARRQRGEGYQAGLTMKSNQMGPPPKMSRNAVLSVRLEQWVIEKIPRKPDGKLDTDWIRATFVAQMERDSARNSHIETH